jgi:phosphatidylserine decarboxylase
MNRLRAGAEWLAATAVSSPALSRVTGRLSDLRLPPFVLRRLIDVYAWVFGVLLEEAEQPTGAYRSFNAFFTRRLRPGARPVDRRPDTVISPADARLRTIGAVPQDGRLPQLKGSDYSLEALLGSAADAAPFRHGAHATLYLSPGMYHRVHAPVAGRISGWRYVAGRLFPVNGPGVRAIPGLFTRNERICVFLESDAHGAVALVLVGAANVGRITLSFADLVTNLGQGAVRATPPEPIPVERGDELGAFNLGSTVVLLVADGSLVPVVGGGDLVRVGQPLWGR